MEVSIILNRTVSVRRGFYWFRSKGIPGTLNLYDFLDYKLRKGDRRSLDW